MQSHRKIMKSQKCSEIVDIIKLNLKSSDALTHVLIHRMPAQISAFLVQPNGLRKPKFFTVASLYE